MHPLAVSWRKTYALVGEFWREALWFISAAMLVAVVAVPVTALSEQVLGAVARGLGVKMWAEEEPLTCGGFLLVLLSTLVLGAIAIPFSIKAYLTIQDARLLLRSQHEEDIKAEVLVLAVSRIRDDSHFSGTTFLDALVEGLETGKLEWDIGSIKPPDCKTHDYLSLDGLCRGNFAITVGGQNAVFRDHLPWQTGFQCVQAVIKTPLRRIHLVPSSGRVGTEEIAESHYVRILQTLIEKEGKSVEKVDWADWSQEQYLSPQEKDVVIILHEGVDYEDFDLVETRLDEIVAREESKFGKATRIAFDITAGQKSYSAVAVLTAKRENIFYCYVKQTDDPRAEAHVVAYDVVLAAIEPG